MIISRLHVEDTPACLKFSLCAHSELRRVLAANTLVGFYYSKLAIEQCLIDL